MSAFAALAVILTGVGLYGLLSFQVLRRTPEMGIRMALGAKRMHVVLMVVKEAALLAGVGIVSGSLAAFVLTRILSSVLVGVRSNDPLVYAAVAGTLFCVALIASFTPARRASGIDPAVSLRYN
jgi:putative ABC transport system permease protein